MQFEAGKRIHVSYVLKITNLIFSIMFIGISINKLYKKTKCIGKTDTMKNVLKYNIF